jgi:ABC-2 type transport system permease protein
MRRRLGEKMINIFTKECRQLFADKKIWIGVGLVLIIIIIGTSYHNQANSQNGKTSPLSSGLLRLGIINRDDSIYSDMLLRHFESSETFTSFVKVEMGKEDAIKNAYRKKKIDLYMIIPKDFAKSMMVLDHKPIEVNINIQDTTKAIILSNILKSYEKYISAVEENAVGLYEIMNQDGMEQEIVKKTNEKISMDLILTAVGREAFFSFTPLAKFPTASVVSYYWISVLVMIFLYAGLYVGFQILGEIRLGTLMRLKTTDTGIFGLLLGKMLLTAAILTVLVTLTGQALCQSMLNLQMCLFGFSVSMFCVTFAAFLGSLFHTPQRFLLAGNLLIFFWMIMGGGIIPIQFLPENIIRIARLTPNYYMMRGFFLLKQGAETKATAITGVFLAVSLLLFGVAGFLLSRRSVTYE